MYREFDVGRQRRRDEAERDLTLAWHVEALHRHKTLPALATLLTRSKGKQSPADLVSSLYLISEQYGLKIRRTRKES